MGKGSRLSREEEISPAIPEAVSKQNQRLRVIIDSTSRFKGNISTDQQGFAYLPKQRHVLTLTYDGLHSTVYLDGEKIHSKTWNNAAWLPHPSNPHLHVFNCQGCSPFNGYIDDLTLWNRSLG